MNRLFLFTALLAGCLASLAAAPAPRVTLGIVGDSLSDEYFEVNARAYARNWVQQLAENRDIDPGPTAAEAGQPNGSWGVPRQTGYEYNWAESGSASYSMLQPGQLDGLAAQVATGGVSCVVVAIGANDFHPYGEAYSRIYDGAWSSARIQAYAAKTLANIETALAGIRRSGAQLVLVNLVDFSPTPFAAANPLYPDAVKRERITLVLQELNNNLKSLAQEYQVPLVDWFGLQKAATGPVTNLNQFFLLGNRPILMQQIDPGPGVGSNPTAGYVVDGYHPHTTIQGMFANAILQALNSGYGANVPLFTEEEILSHAGLAYGGADTLSAWIGSYTNYVFFPVPLGPTGHFQFLFPTKAWSVQLDLRSKISPKTGKSFLAARAVLTLPNGDVISYPERVARCSAKKGYSFSFKGGTNTSVQPNAPDKKSTIRIKGMTMIKQGSVWNPTVGTLSYRILGQKGTGNLTDFVE